MENLPVLHFNKQYMSNTKIGRSITDKYLEIDTLEKLIPVTITESIINLVDIWKDESITVSNPNITPFDMAVMDAAYTIMCSGHMIITPEWISSVLSGNRDQRPTPKKLEAIQKSIDKLRCVHIRINFKNEANARTSSKDKKDSFVYESYLLPLDKMEVKYKANGKTVIAYPVLSKPALYRYAEFVHQIVDVPAELLDTHGDFSDTDEAILIKRYVIKRVAQIISDNNLHSNKISYLWYDKDTKEKRGLFTELRYTPDNTKKWSNKKQKINRIVYLTLQSLVVKGVIAWFEPYREGGSSNPTAPIMGYRIQTLLPPCIDD